ncbi:MAG TPA: aminotransferase class V-fold PLP-dependent enzyme, partial [Terriglobales bacterium]
PVAWPGLVRMLQAGPGPAGEGSEAYWQIVKRQFPLEDNLVYMNAANVCPASRPVADRHLELLRDFYCNPSMQNREKYKALRERLRGKLASLFRVTPDEIAILRNTSEANNTIVRGIVLKAGDEVLITDHNHQSNREAWTVRAGHEGFTVRSLPVQAPAQSLETLCSGFEKAITPRTKVIAISHVTNTTGLRYPVREIAELARKRGIWMHVDGAQTFGALDVDLRAIACDSFTASAHKWAMGPLEAGLLYIRAERLQQLHPSSVTAGWVTDLKGARKFEVLGQQDDPRVVAFEAAVDFLNLVGMANIQTRVLALAASLNRGLARLPNVHLLTNDAPELSAGVVKFRLRNSPTRLVYENLWEKRRIAAALTPSGDAEGVRLSPHVYNSPAEVDLTIEAVKALAG